jgi:DNA-binding helix-turn-helix protein
MNKNLFLQKLIAAGYTQKSLAQEIGMAKNTLCNKINDKTKFSTDEVVLICDILGIKDNSEKAQIFLSKTS